MEQKKEITIFTKPTQSGKTNDAIINPTIKNVSSGAIQIVIIPSRITLQRQLFTRFLKSGIQKDEIVLFDTGVSHNERVHSFKEILDNQKVKIIIVLGNHSGLLKLINLVLNSKKKFSMVIDEIHNFLNFKVNKEIFEIKWELFTNFANTQKTKNVPVELNMEFTFGEKIYFLMRHFTIKQFSITGTTATVSYISQCDSFHEEFKFKIQHLETPKDYISFDNIKVSNYDNFEDILKHILMNNLPKCSILSHVGRTTQEHLNAKDLFFNVLNYVYEQVLPEDFPKGVALISNTNGYQIYTSKDNHVIIKKGDVSEMWVIHNELRKNNDYIFIIGDRCISESITVQKTDEIVNCPVEHYIYVPPKKVSYSKGTQIIQKIGRMTGIDCNGNSREIHIPNSKIAISPKKEVDVKTFIENCYKIETQLQESKLTKAEYKRAVKNVQSEQKQKKETFDDFEDRFTKYKNNQNTCISRFICSLNSEMVYTQEELLELLNEAGYKYPDAILRSMSMTTPSGKFVFHIFDNNDGQFKMTQNIAQTHKKVFT